MKKESKQIDLLKLRLGKALTPAKPNGYALFIDYTPKYILENFKTIKTFKKQ